MGIVLIKTVYSIVARRKWLHQRAEGLRPDLPELRYQDAGRHIEIEWDMGEVRSSPANCAYFVNLKLLGP